MSEIVVCLDDVVNFVETVLSDSISLSLSLSLCVCVCMCVYVCIRQVSGAIQCANLWMWTDVPSFLPESATQPPLQLSLDYPMFENYGDGVMADYSNANAAARRHGIEFEPLVNCMGEC